MTVLDAILTWALKKLVLWKRQRITKKNGEENIIIKLVDAVIDELELQLIAPASATTTATTAKIEKLQKLKN